VSVIKIFGTIEPNFLTDIWLAPLNRILSVIKTFTTNLVFMVMATLISRSGSSGKLVQFRL